MSMPESVNDYRAQSQLRLMEIISQRDDRVNFFKDALVVNPEKYPHQPEVGYPQQLSRHVADKYNLTANAAALFLTYLQIQHLPEVKGPYGDEA